MDARHWSVELGRGLGGIELGADRQTVLQRLDDAGIAYDADEADRGHVELPEMDVELTFQPGGAASLIQIAIQDDRVQF